MKQEKRSLKIIQIKGIRGLIVTVLVGACLVAGFVAFPGFVIMSAWNLFASETFPALNLAEGTLLWGIIFVSYMILRKKSYSISFGVPPELNDDELKQVIARAQEESNRRLIGSATYDVKGHEEKAEDEKESEEIINK